jgi:hypothetical protein
MRAIPLIRKKLTHEDGSVTEVVVWRIPSDARRSEHVRYRMAFIPRNHKRPAVLFDNHDPKGHHKHVDGVEDRYPFSDVSALIADFDKEVERWKEANR